MGRPAELREPDRLGGVTVLDHHLTDDREVREPPAVLAARVAVLGRVIAHALVGVRSQDVERVPAAEGVHLANPAVVVRGRACEDDLGVGIPGLEAGIGGVQELNVLRQRAAEVARIVRFVPDLPGVDPATPVSGGPAGEVGVIDRVGRRRLVGQAAVRPARCEPQRDQHLHAARSGLVDAEVDHADVPGVPLALVGGLDAVPGGVDTNPRHPGSLQPVEHADAVSVVVEGPVAVELAANLGTGGRRGRRRRRRRRR
jgi:hypothetical protein